MARGELTKSRSQAGQTLLERAAAGGKGDAKKAFARDAVRAAVNDDDAVLLEQKAANAIGSQPPLRVIGEQLTQIEHDKQPTVGNQGADARNSAERLNHQISAGLVFGRHLLDGVLIRLECAYG